jgi:hypothetical protein
MAFGKRKQRDDKDVEEDVSEKGAEQDALKGEVPAVERTAWKAEAVPAAVTADDGLEGPFEIEDFDDPEVATVGRLDLGSVLIPLPAAGQVQVELSPTGVPSTVWVVTPNGRFTIAAYAAPKSAGLWREVATELAESLRKDSAQVSIETGPWGREVVGSAAGALRFIGVDGYRWMVRCVVNGSHESVAALVVEARSALADTVVRRGDTPLPVRTPLPVQLPEPMAAQLAAAAEQAAQQQQGLPQEQEQAPPEPAARRSAQGSAMQQLKTITGG